ncbi:inter-alpha-trypsin inhibitor heavy chain H3 isoform X2 [Macadamia integrifolia]|uniref:inter-alpha-trypsin inhibitor heavy chain H3 isoform X2 n=1 Tax=Macadamia integrifolia TaxID=60698 RepID=UPI001C4E840C|nr:inter-alpha-trypsin inhibitor heavy chain H3 isoform X2 [Macadamia integrifolia]
MAEVFVKSVENGLKLSKRIYFGKDRDVLPPKIEVMETNLHSYLPTAPMVYAVIYDPSIVDNPDIRSYQPHVYGCCDPPALIPLQMNGIALEVQCYLDTAIITVSGSWRVHCVIGSSSCDCRLAIPMSEKGSILGVEVDVARKSYSTQLVAIDEKIDVEKLAKTRHGSFLKPQIFTVTIPMIDGGSNLSIKVGWSQKIFYSDGQFSLDIPFSFPEYVTPFVKRISKPEKIQLNVTYDAGTEILCKTTSHPLKEIRRQAGNLGFLYEADVLTWSKTDFNISYMVMSSEISGGLLLQSPSVHDFDQREIFCFYLFPGNHQHRKVFRKEVVFIVDISGSMKGGPLENLKNGLFTVLSKLNPEDSFNIIAFNGETYLFSSLLELATKETIEKASQWINLNFIAEGGTNILLPLNQAMEMLSNTCDSIPLIFLIIDGSVEDERHICDAIKSNLRNRESMAPRISTLGIGSYCNHYFLQMLALISGGHYDAAYDADSIVFRMQRLFRTASSTILANITIDIFEHLDVVEVYPFHIPDLLSGSPLVVSGRYHGNVPSSLKARGVLGDMKNFVIDLKVQKPKDIPLDKIVAKQQIDVLTAQAWLLENKAIEEKVAKMSIQTSVPSEYTCLVLLQIDKGKQASKSFGIQQRPLESEGCKVILLRSLGLGFGNLKATAENIPLGFVEGDSSEPADILINAASNCCGKLADYFCCMCCIKACSTLNNQCAITLTQLCTVLSCFGCISFCSDLCTSC